MTHRLFLLALVASAGLTACNDDNDITFEQCELDLELAPATAAPGDAVTATGRPQSERLDTAVRVEGVEAEVVSVERTAACSACDACRESETVDCGACETCEACASECADCAEVTTFTVPDVPAGPVSVVVTNRFGTSEPIPFEVQDAPTED